MIGHDCDVQRARRQVLLQLDGKVELDFVGNAGQGSAQLRHRAGEPCHGDLAHSDTNGAGGIRDGFRIGEGVFHRQQQRLDALGKTPRRYGQLQPAASFLEQRKAQRLLQFLHARRHRGLRGMQALGGGAEAAQLRDQAEGFGIDQIGTGHGKVAVTFAGIL
ncbi:hypothetical protein D3C72_1274020 [compost metagenome]